MKKYKLYDNRKTDYGIFICEYIKTVDAETAFDALWNDGYHNVVNNISILEKSTEPTLKPNITRYIEAIECQQGK